MKSIGAERRSSRTSRSTNSGLVASAETKIKKGPTAIRGGGAFTRKVRGYGNSTVEERTKITESSSRSSIQANIPNNNDITQPRKTTQNKEAMMKKAIVILNDLSKEHNESIKERIIPITFQTKNENSKSKDIETNRLPSSLDLYKSDRQSQKTDVSNEASTVALDDISSKLRSSAVKTLNIINNIRESLSRDVSAAPSDFSRYTRSVSPSYFDEDEEYSDLENKKTDEYDTGFLSRNAKAPTEFGGVWGISILIIIIPIIALYLTTNIGNIEVSRIYKSFSLETIPHLTVETFSVYTIYNIVLFGLSLLLFGRTVRMPRNDQFVALKFNAFPISVLAIGALFIGEHYKYNVVDYILDNEWQFNVFGLINAFILSIYIYVAARLAKKPIKNLNVYGNTGNCIVDYALGANLSTNLKQACYRTQLITTAMLAVCYLYKELPLKLMHYELNIKTNSTEELNLTLPIITATFLSASMLIVYCLDSILFEHHLASSFELQSEGVGYLLLLRYAVSPYLLSAIVRDCYERQLQLENVWIACIAVVLLFIGLFLKRFSNAVKYKYRLNPTLSYFDDVETIHTYQGRRLLVDRFWGSLRQPNYTGDIIALLGLSLSYAVASSWKAKLCLLLIVVLLIHRALRVNERNQQRYHSSWMRYRQKVKNYIIIY